MHTNHGGRATRIVGSVHRFGIKPGGTGWAPQRRTALFDLDQMGKYTPDLLGYLDNGEDFYLRPIFRAHCYQLEIVIYVDGFWLSAITRYNT